MLVILCWFAIGTVTGCGLAVALGRIRKNEDRMLFEILRDRRAGR